MNKAEHLWSVTMLEIHQKSIMASKEFTMRMEDHVMSSSILKISHTKEAVNTAIYGTTSIADSMDKICVT